MNNIMIFKNGITSDYQNDKQKRIKILKLMHKFKKLEQQKTEYSFKISKNSVFINEFSKILKQNGYNIGANKLFEKLRQDGYLIKQKGQNWNLPTQKSMELGLFEVKKTIVNKFDGRIITKFIPKVTSKGQLYFINKFLIENDTRLIKVVKETKYKT